MPGKRCRRSAIAQYRLRWREIKGVSLRASKINLMAMNAIFLAKRAGPAALGFCVLSNELRCFADDLRAQMKLLGDITLKGVNAVTALVKEARTSRVLDRAMAESVDGRRTMVSEVVRRHGDKQSERGERIQALNRRLTQLIADIAQLVELGSVLARSAKIEAAYGAEFSGPLTQVASDFEEIIDGIRGSLASLAKRPFIESSG